MQLHPSKKIYVAQSKIPNSGRGVFAAKQIQKDELIEICPVLHIKESDLSNLRQTELINYYFQWKGNEKYHSAAICLGFGSLYNHSYIPNAVYIKKLKEDIIEIIALKNISINEEITLNYNHGDPSNKSTLWIKAIPPYKEN